MICLTVGLIRHMGVLLLLASTVLMSMQDELDGGWLEFARAHGYDSDNPLEPRGVNVHHAVLSSDAPSAPVIGNLGLTGVEQNASQQALYNPAGDVSPNDQDSVEVFTTHSGTLTGLASRSAGLEERLGASANSGIAKVSPQSKAIPPTTNTGSADTIPNVVPVYDAFTDGYGWMQNPDVVGGTGVFDHVEVGGPQSTGPSVLNDDVGLSLIHI